MKIIQPRLSEKVRTILLILYLAVTGAYLVWRVVCTMNYDHPIYSILFLAAEIFCLFSAFIFYTLIVRRNDRPTRPGAAPDLSVDVFIATYNEEAALIRRTAIAARDMHYKHKTWICDDGRRPEIKALARELGIGYITRFNNDHFKAGNLNNALAQTRGDCVMVLDADHVPQPHFLTRLMGYFNDPAVALIQTPQIYYNIDSFQHHVSTKSRTCWHEAGLFHHAMQPGADRFNAAFFVGTGAVLRRKALEEIGGFATESITEDIHTSMRLHARGFRSIYIDEALGFMLAADTPLAYTRQRLRWAQGAMQILRRENPLTIKGLSLWQRLTYLNSLAGYLAAYQHLIFYLAPGIYLFTRVSPIAIDPYVGFPIFVAHIVLDIVMYKLLASPQAKLFLGECFKVLNVSIFIRASMTLFSPDGLSFRVTPKGRHQGLPYDLLVLPALVFLFNLTAVGFGLIRLSLGDGYISAVILTIFFAAMFSLAGALALLHVHQREVAEEMFSFPVAMTAKLFSSAVEPVEVHIRRLGSEHIYFLSPRHFRTGDTITIDLAAIGIERGVSAIIVASHHSIDKHYPGYMIFKARFDHLSQGEKDSLENYLFNRAFPHFLAGFKDGPNLGDAYSEIEKSEIFQDLLHIKSGIV